MWKLAFKSTDSSYLYFDGDGKYKAVGACANKVYSLLLPFLNSDKNILIAAIQIALDLGYTFETTHCIKKIENDNAKDDTQATTLVPYAYAV